MKTSLTIIAALAALVTPGLAGAASSTVTVTKPATINLQVGAGAAGFSAGLNGDTDPGLSWDVRAIFGPHSPLGLEAAYFGGLNPVKSNTHDALESNGGEALARLNFGAATRVHPYVAAGVGFDHISYMAGVYGGGGSGGSTGGGGGGGYEAPHALNVAGYRSSSDLEIPAAVGIDGEVGKSVTLGARAGYRYLFNDQTRVGMGSSSAQQWNATARLGILF